MAVITESSSSVYIRRVQSNYIIFFLSVIRILAGGFRKGGEVK